MMAPHIGGKKIPNTPQTTIFSHILSAIFQANLLLTFFQTFVMQFSFKAFFLFVWTLTNMERRNKPHQKQGEKIVLSLIARGA